MKNCIWLVGLVCLLIGGLWLVHSRVHKEPVVRPENVRQMAQLHSVTAALELHANVFDAYPPSDANDRIGAPYCGAMKLCEAVIGQDLLGMHSQSVYRADGLDKTGTLKLYPDDIRALGPAERGPNLRARKGPYIQPENANAFRLADIYGEGQTGPFDPNIFVLCDTYVRKRPGGEKTGMPVLYYRANPDGTTHDVNAPSRPDNIYDHRDNQMLLALGVPDEPNTVHPLSDPKRFYMNIQNTKIHERSTPHRADSLILISASYDGLYGTADDICNFKWKYRK